MKSLNAMHTTTTVGTIRLAGTIQGHPITILIDGGSDDTFLQPWVVDFLKLPVLPSPPTKVLVGNGHTLQIEAFILNLNLIFQGYSFQLLPFVQAVAGADLIVGVS